MESADHDRRGVGSEPLDRHNPLSVMRKASAIPNPVRAREDFLVFGQPVLEDAEIVEVVDSLQRGWIGTGPKVQRFERMLEEYVGVPHVRCVSSCTAALMLGLLALDAGEGDEVIAPTMTFAASVNAILHVGASPVLVDCEPVTGQMNLDAVEAAVGPKTKAIIAVHLSGRPLDVDRLNSIRDRHGVAIVEDAAHALGAEWRGQKIGCYGNLTAFSFYATKNVTTAEGGALATVDAAVAERIERLSLHGLSAGAWQRYSDAGFKHYEVVELGYKFNLTDLHAALGIHQLPRLDGWIQDRARVWQRYDDAFASLPVTTPLPAEAGTTHARHLYQLLIEDGSARSRDDLLDFLAANGIGVGVHYRAVHLHEYYRNRFGYEPEQFPVARGISDRTLSLPLSPTLSERDQDDVIEAVALGCS
jgi:dTDP-4-amino-4,6-dideoxygalactose transaminase